MSKPWKIALFVALILAMSGFFLAVMRPPGGQPSTPGQDLPWQASAGPNGATLVVFGLTLGESTLREAVAKWGRRYALGLFQDRNGALNLEAYFRDAVVGGLNVRMVLTARLPPLVLDALRARAGPGAPTADGGRRHAVAESDAELGLEGVIVAITYMPMVKFDAELVRKRFGEPSERVTAPDGAHWLYPERGLDLLLGANGEALLQYVPPADFARRLRAPLDQNRGP